MQYKGVGVVEDNEVEEEEEEEEGGESECGLVKIKPRLLELSRTGKC